MIMPVYPIVPHASALSSPATAPVVGYAVRLSDRSQAADLYHRLGNYNAGNFFIHITMEDDLAGLIDEVLLPFLFLPGYFLTPQGYLLSVDAPPDQTVHDQLREILNAQGMPPYLFILGKGELTVTGGSGGQSTAGLPEGHTERARLYEDLASLSSAYKEALTDPGLMAHCFFYQATDPGVWNDVMLAVQEKEKEFIVLQPKLFRIWSRTNELTSLLAKKEAMLASAKRELENYNAYNNVLREGHSEVALQQYYTEQYEVLPTWFKRLGHLVKIFSGKKSVKGPVVKKGGNI